MAITFFHLSDTHLGYYDFENTGPSGENIRENDVYRAFEYVVDKAIEEKPDFVLHSGDLFHRSAPNNRTLVEAGRILKKLGTAGIPFYMIAGNHDYPKSILTYPIHSLFEENAEGKIFYSEKYETVDCGKYIIHGLPHINDDALLQEELEKIQITKPGVHNILMLHLSVGDSYIMKEFGERMLPKDKRELLKTFTYVALGHWHKPQQLEKFGNTYYAGSTERISSSEAEHPHGYYKVTMGDSTDVSFQEIPLRMFKRFSVKECSRKNREEILDEVRTFAGGIVARDGIFIVRLEDMKQAQFYEISREDIQEIFPDALFAQVERIQEGSTIAADIDGESIDFNDKLLETVTAELTDPAEKAKAGKILRDLLEQLDEQEASRED